MKKLVLGVISLLALVGISAGANGIKSVSEQISPSTQTAPPASATLDATTTIEPLVEPASTPPPAPVDTPSPQPEPESSSSNLSNDNYYTNSAGNEVHSPAESEDGSVPEGASARCGDGTYSFSQSRRGTCSHHGGVAQWL